MSTFILYLRLGYRHIMDLHNVDHMLFIIALVAIFLIRDWKKVLILMLFYIISLSLTLTFSVKNIITPDPDVIRYFVPLTVFLAAVSNIFRGQKTIVARNPSKYIFTAIFGVVHGFGFASYLKNIFGYQRIVTGPLVAFNLGLTLGLFLVALIFLIITWIFVNNLGIGRRDWYLVISSAIAGVALTLMFESRYWLE